MQFVEKNWKGSTTYSLKKKFSHLVNAVTSFSSLPLIFIFYAGLMISLSAAIFILYLAALYFLTSENYNLISISLLILLKEIILLFLRLNFLKTEIKQVKNFYLLSLYFLIVLFLSFHFKNLYYLSIIPLVISIFKNDYK